MTGMAINTLLVPGPTREWVRKATGLGVELTRPGREVHLA